MTITEELLARGLKASEDAAYERGVAEGKQIAYRTATGVSPIVSLIITQLMGDKTEEVIKIDRRSAYDLTQVATVKIEDMGLSPADGITYRYKVTRQ